MSVGVRFGRLVRSSHICFLCSNHSMKLSLRLIEARVFEGSSFGSVGVTSETVVEDACLSVD